MTLSLAIKAYLGGAWSDITADTLGTNVSANWGMSSNAPTDFLAKTGQMSFSLKNNTGKYTPGGSAVISADWKKGTKVIAVFTYNSQEWVRFRGAVDTLRIDAGTQGERKVHVTVLDWMDYAAKYPLSNPAIALNQRADQAIETIVDGMPIQPQATSYQVGANTFPTVFNNAVINTRAYSEFKKLADSEYAPIYLRKDKDYGETLYVESANSRVYSTAVKKVKVVDTSVEIADEAGEEILDEASEAIMSEGYTYQNITVSNTMSGMEVVYGDGLVNRISTSVNPTRIDTVETNIYKLDSPLYLSTGQSKSFSVQFTEENSKRLVSSLPPEFSFPTTLLHFNNGGARVIVDESGKQFEAYDVELVANVKKFGNAAGYLDGTNSYIEGTYSLDYEFGAGDFTVEWWEYRISASSGLTFMARSGAGGFVPWVFGYSDGTNALVYMSSNGSSWDMANGVSFGAITLNTMTKYAISRSGSNFYMFVNGTLVNYFTSSATIPASTANLSIGKNGSSYFNGVIDEVRITKGLCRYTTTHTVEDTEFGLSGLVKAAWTAQNGTGTELSDDFTLSIEYGAAGANITVTNEGATPGWLTTLKIFGKIVETVSPVIDIQENTESILEYGYHELSINQPYQHDFTSGREKSAQILEAERQPKTEINKISMYANRDEAHTMYFLESDIGELVEIEETQTETDAAFFITGMGWDAVPGDGGAIVNYWWNVRKFREDVTPIGVRFGDPASFTPTRLNYGYLPAVAVENVHYRIWSYWIYSARTNGTLEGYPIYCWNGSAGSDFKGYNIRHTGASGGQMRFRMLNGTIANDWRVSYTLSANTWTHYLIAHDASSPAAPTVYKNGVALATPTSFSSWSVDEAGEVGTEMQIGGVGNTETNLTESTLEDFRIYNGNTIGITVAQLAANLAVEARYGDANTDGLLFRGFHAPISEVADYEGQSLTENLKVIDDIGLAVGTPYDEPLGTAA